MKTYRLVTAAPRLLLALGICLLGYSLLEVLDSAVYRKQARAEIERALAASRVSIESEAAARRASLDDASLADSYTEEAPAVTAVAAGEPIGVLRVPRLEMSVVVLEGVDRTTLRRGAGRIPGTGLPGEPGNVGIAAHRDGLFRPLEGIRPGDRIELVAPDGRWAYEVTGTTIVTPERVDVLDEGPDRDLTLVTCYPFTMLGAAPERFIVHARQVGSEAH